MLVTKFLKYPNTVIFKNLFLDFGSISLVFCCPVSWKKMLSRESVGHRELGPSTGLSGQSPAVPAWTAALSGPVSNSRAGETSAGSTTVPRPHTLEAGPGSHLFLDRGQLL